MPTPPDGSANALAEPSGGVGICAVQLGHALTEPSGGVGICAVQLGHALAEPSGAIFFCAFARKKRPLRFGLSDVFGTSAVSVFIRSWYIEP